jgi:modification methylase
MPEELYQQWQVEVLNECYRVLKPDGSMFYNHKNRIKNGIQITPYEWLLKSNFIIKQEIVWQNGSQNFDKIRFYPMTERVYWLAKDRKTKMFNAINHHDIFKADEWKPVRTKGTHKRAFPEEMCLDIISCFPAADVVLDPFVGSGTTALAAMKSGKNYIGFDISKEYCEIARKRLGTAVIQLSLGE